MRQFTIACSSRFPASGWVFLCAVAVMALGARPALAQFTADPPEILLDVPQGSDPASIKVTLSSGDAGTYGFSVLQPESAWLGASPASGLIENGTGTFYVDFTTSDLQPGFYWDYIVVGFQEPASALVPNDVYLYVTVHVYPLNTPPMAGTVGIEAAAEFYFEGGVAMRPGNYLALFVQPEGTLPMRFQWQFAPDGTSFQDLSDAPGMTGALTEWLEIPHAAPENTGFYRCVVANDFGTTTTGHVEVIVLTPPFIKQQPEDRTVLEREYTLFFVVAAGTPELRYEWFRLLDESSSESLRLDPRFLGAETRGLIIESAELDMSGQYVCVVSNDYGTTTSLAATLTVNRREPPTITDDPTTQTVAAGGRAAFTVGARGDEPLGFAWEFSTDGVVFAPLEDGGSIHGATSSTLAIDPADLTAAGFYQCRVYNTVDEAFSASAALIILNPPVIANLLADQTVSVGAPFYLSLDVTGSPPLHFAWTRDGHPVGADSPSFFLQAAQESDAGDYVCRVTNAVGEDISNAARLTVVRAPVITRHPQSLSTHLGNYATFHVGAVGLAPLVYQWELSADGSSFAPLADDGERVVGSDSSALSILSVVAADARQYRCVVANEAGSAISDPATLGLQPSPGLLAVNLTALSLAVTQGENAAPSVILLRNPGDQPLDYTAETTGETWVSDVSPPTGTLGNNPVNLIVTFDTASLDFGEYDDVLTLTPQNSEQPPIEISIHLVVVDAFGVATDADDGPHSLRQAIQLANQTAGPQTITFHFSGVIRPLSELPALDDSTGGTTIDGASSMTLSGERLHGSENGLVIRSSGNVVKNLTIVRFPGNGILITGPDATDNRVVHCFVGTDGERDMGNMQSGIRIDGGASNNTIGGDIADEKNTISGNSFSAITLEAADSNHILGNYLGINAAGDGTIPNGGNGILILPSAASDNSIGGDTVFERNVIAGNRFYVSSVDVMEGTRVSIQTAALGPGTLSYQWKHDGDNIGTDSAVYHIASAAASDAGIYTCEVANENGTDVSDPIRLNVLTTARFVASNLVGAFGSLDTNLDGLLDFGETNAAAKRVFRRTRARLASLPPEDFQSLDANGDGFLSIEEMVTALQIPDDDRAFRVLPEGLDFGSQDIDEGSTAPLMISLENLGVDDLAVPTTPTLTGATNDFRYAWDSDQRSLGQLEYRDFILEFDPTAVNGRAVYMSIQTDNFLLPVYPVLLTGFGYQTSAELISQLLGRAAPPAHIGEVDVNGDSIFDAADIAADRKLGY